MRRYIHDMTNLMIARRVIIHYLHSAIFCGLYRMISMLMPMTCEIHSEASGKSPNFLDIDAINAPSTNTNQGDVRNYKEHC